LLRMKDARVANPTRKSRTLNIAGGAARLSS
jgi:hypothetical protein